MTGVVKSDAECVSRGRTRGRISSSDRDNNQHTQEMEQWCLALLDQSQ
jgi:hypothetical protein